MSRGRGWTREELLLAMDLYCRLPFGRMDHRNRDVRGLAALLGRTPGSVAMKLSNLASLDPGLQARGIKGLRGAGRMDRAVWVESQADWERFANEVGRLLRSRRADSGAGGGAAAYADEEGRGEFPPTPFQGPTERVAAAKSRRGQEFFRRAVLAAYESRCCVTENPVRGLLAASHILPWKEFPEHRVDPRNGLCLARTQDTAFDRGLISFDEEDRLILSRRLRRHDRVDTIRRNFLDYEGKQFRPPSKFLPDPVFLRRHREEIFRE